MKEEVESVLETLRPMLIQDGGNVELVDIEDGIVNTGAMQPIARMGYMEYAVVKPDTVFTLNRPEMNPDGTLANSQPDSWDGTYG